MAQLKAIQGSLANASLTSVVTDASGGVAIDPTEVGYAHVRFYNSHASNAIVITVTENDGSTDRVVEDFSLNSGASEVTNIPYQVPDGGALKLQSSSATGDLNYSIHWRVASQ